MSMNFSQLTAQTTLSGESLVRDISRSILAIQNTSKQTRSNYKTWSMQAKAPVVTKTGSAPSETPLTTMFEMTMMSFFMHALFGLPMMQGFGLTDDTINSLGMIGNGLHHSLADGTSPGSRSEREMSYVDPAFIRAQQTQVNAALGDQASRIAEMTDMKKMVLAMLMMLLMQNSGDEGKCSSTGSDDMVAPDVLRHPKLARFKQNRHSLDCIRTMFQEQAVAKTAPRLPALRYA